MLDLGTSMKRGSSHQAYNGGAIRVSNECSLSSSGFDVLHCFRVHFGNYQWDILVHPKRGAVVDDHRSPIDGDGAEVLANGAAGAEERDVDAIEALRRQLLHDVVPVLKGDAAPSGALGREHFDGAVGEVAVGEDGEELLADGAGDAHDGDGGAVFLEGHSDPGRGKAGLGLGPGRERAREEVVVARNRE